MNPFLIRGYKTPSYFCDRTKETDTLVQAATNGRDITLYSLRRMGKTGLIYNAAYYLQKQYGCIIIFSDILSTNNEKELIDVLVNNIVQQAYPKRQWLSKATEALKSIAPTISFDPLTGLPNVSITTQNQQEVFNSLEHIFGLVNNLDKPVYWAFDEFQQILNYPNPSPIFNKLRTLVQQCDNVQFVFSGSHRGMLLSIFEDNKAPFFKSTQILQLNEIPEKEYSKFIKNKFKKGNIAIDEESIQQILSLSLGHTWYVQMLCNRLYSNGKPVDVKQVNEMLLKIMDEYEMTYYNYRSLITKKQWKLLQAVALEEKVTQVTSSSFIKKYGLTSSSTVLRALNKLIEDEMIVEIFNEDQKYYRLNDVFLIRWMQKVYYQLKN